MNIVAVVPVKDNSERVPNKNFKDFFRGLSLLELKINHLKSASIFSNIYISSDSKKAKIIADSMGVNFIQRDSKFCNNIIPWSEVILNILESLPEDEDTLIAWCHTTSPFFENYKQAIQTYISSKQNNDDFDGLITVERLNDFIVDEKPQPLNYSWGVWHDYSQNLKKMFRITGALFLTSKKEMIKNRYVISKRPILFISSQLEGIDIDTEFDFKVAKLIIEDLVHVKE
jgi:N-acylneuraminate cytidylyltransferase